MKLWYWPLLALLPGVAPGMQLNHSPALAISSASFTDGGVIALQQVGPEPECGSGEERTPQVSWQNLPQRTQSLVVVMFDPDGAKGMGVVHWLAYNLDPASGGLDEGAAGQSSEVATLGSNSRGTQHYRGPCPPAGDNPHHYVLTVIATDLPAGSLPMGLDRQRLMEILHGHTLGAQSLVGRYGH